MIHVTMPKLADPGRRGVPATVVVRRTEIDDLHDELAAERAEARVLALVALDAVKFIEAYRQDQHLVMHHAGRIDHAARRFLRQRGVL